MSLWLIKSEPDVFSIDDLKNSPGRKTHWDGVRNYQARNFMRDGMKKGDRVLFYHSNCDTPGVAGIAKITKEAYDDYTALDPKDKHYDPTSTAETPRWCMVDVQFERKLSRVISLTELKAYADSKLKDFALLRRGNRLSVMPVSDKQWNFILNLE
jgi:predicted RNA-binding protein with PUA-like domain